MVQLHMINQECEFYGAGKCNSPDSTDVQRNGGITYRNYRATFVGVQASQAMCYMDIQESFSW